MATIPASLARTGSNLGWLWPVARAHWPPVVVFLVSLIFYLITLSPTIFDSVANIEYAATAYGLVIPHPPGNPLYVVLGKLFTFLPFGDIAYRVNLMSAVFAAATSVLIL